MIRRFSVSVFDAEPVRRTSSRPPRAWASIDRPAPVSEKKMIPPAFAGICSEPVRAITVRPEVSVIAM